MPRPTDVHSLIDLFSPAIAPDGSSVIYVRTETDRDAMKVSSRLVRRLLPGGDDAPFSSGPSDGHPGFSPDCRSVAFLRATPDHGKQVHLISTDGGEARLLTDPGPPGGKGQPQYGEVRDFAWSPDAHSLAVVAWVDPERRTVEHDDERSPRTYVARRIRYRDDGDGWRGDGFTQLFVVDVATGKARQLTSGEGNHDAPAWSPDGRRIAFVCDDVEDRDVVRKAEVRVIDVDGGGTSTWSEGMTRVGSVAWSPDGSRLVAGGTSDSDIWDPRQSWLFVLQEGETARQVSDDIYTLVQPVAANAWREDGTIVFIGDRAGESYLCRVGVTADSAEVETLLGGVCVMTSLDLSTSDRAALTWTTFDAPAEIEVVDYTIGSQVAVTHASASFSEDHLPAAVEKVVFERAGVEIQARILYPPEFDGSKTWPLILDIHGGPNGRYSDSYDFLQQVLVGTGAIVLAVNPRGSSSYGPDFLKAVLRDWGGEDFLDLMAAVDLLCERPYVDSNRLGVHGYSYGGFMSSWIVGHDHRFKAAVVGAPCINLNSMYGTSDIGVSFGENQWGGSTIERIELLHERSPLTYVSEVQTPVLLMHGEEDYRCPIEQAEQFFVALKRQRKTVEFVRFSGCSHGFRKSAHPKFREEYLQRMVDWFAKHLAQPKP